MTMTSVLLSLVLVLVSSVVSDYVGQSVAGEVEAGNFTYYTLRQTGHIRMELYSLTGDADIYVSDATNERPTFMFEEHMLSSATCGLDVVDIPESFSRPVHIGVYGHPNYSNTTFNMDGVIVEETEEDHFAMASYKEEGDFQEHEEAKSRSRRDSGILSLMIMMVTHDTWHIRKEAIMIADRERRMKYKKQEEARESVRQNLRDKVIFTLSVTFIF